MSRPSSDCHSGYYSSLAPRAPCCGPRSCPLATLLSSVSWAGTHHATFQLTALHLPCLPTCSLSHSPGPHEQSCAGCHQGDDFAVHLSLLPEPLLPGCGQDLSLWPGQPSASLHPDGGRPSWPDSLGSLCFPAQFSFPPILCFCFSLITASFPASLK